jgi:hypothetical protein
MSNYMQQKDMTTWKWTSFTTTFILNNNIKETLKASSTWYNLSNIIWVFKFEIP